MNETDDARRVLGIDPGSHATGWAVVVAHARRPTVEAAGLIRLRRSDPFPVRLRALQRAFEEMLARTRPDLACVETPFHGVNARAALQLAHARGVLLAALAGAGVEVHELSPATVKRTVAGSGRAAKDQVQFMIRRLLAIDGDLESEDVSDALAIAYCAAVGVGPSAATTPRPARSPKGAHGPGGRRGVRVPVVRNAR